MAKHVLSLEIPDVLNSCIIRVIDTSVYDPTIPLECPKLEITSPGFWEASIVPDIEPGFIENITACALGIQTTNCTTTFNTLPDGVYIARYSVSPNDIVFVEYNHLRITSALKKYSNVLCCLDIRGCDPTAEIDKFIRELQFIRTLFDAAKAKVEYCHSPKHGMDIYLYALKRLNKLSCLCGCGNC